MQEPLRVLAFAGSTRRASFNQALVGIAADGAREAGAEVTEIELRDYRLPVFDQDDESEHGKPEPARRLEAAARRPRRVARRRARVQQLDHRGAQERHRLGVAARSRRPRSAGGVPRQAHRADERPRPACWAGLRGLVHVRAILGNLGCVVLPDQVAVPKAREAFDAEGRLVDPEQQRRVQGLGRTLVEHGRKLFG